MENPERIFYIILGVYLIGSGFLIAEPGALTDSRSFEQASEDVGFCKSVSNRWPMLSYAGTPTGPLETQLRSEEEYLDFYFRDRPCPRRRKLPFAGKPSKIDLKQLV
ncbi:hypothetical protein HRED_08890 [Candidatus Haloredivivus sp. G17]|nr:hypothetical protein HRED_08890 [Candidatus Haloredivivus sp. G17]